MPNTAPTPEPPQAQLEEVRRARLASSRPTLARTLSASSALCVGAGVALLAQGRPGWSHLAFLIAAVALMAAGQVLANLGRRRRGVFGYRGWSKAENTTFLLCAVALAIAGFPGGGELAAIFIGLGAASAAAWYLMLRGVLVSDGRRCA